ncbi:uncharacterized protein LOC108221475 [Daucus carota subsp. sativus]|uniref:uncharacterized protein LOC108221475 n=1 Tax=Daucus carota subsp. sativus TaxID=79200 RepID=UPI0007EF1C5D|nr:PREDICTED: uncharacterized protein LOC108221475 [Daucus carota subsp. sativus]
MARALIRYHIGSPSSIKFWLDPWVRNKPFCHQFDDTAIGHFGSNKPALIRDFQEESSWVFPVSNHMSSQEIRNRISEIHILSSDFITWDGLLRCKIATVWNSIRHKSPHVPWFDTVWNSLSIYKCSFTLWTALKERLLTRDRMLRFRMQTQPGCLLCNNMESIQHIFTGCPYFDLICRACPVPFARDWPSWQNGNFFSPTIDKRKQIIGSLFLAVAVHLVWKERNLRLHNPGSSNGTLYVIKNIFFMVREKLFSCDRFRKWVHRDPSFLCLIY